VAAEKRVVWAPPIPLADVVEVAHRTGSTVNDVLVAALAGALSTYVRSHHGEAVDIPTMVPVNVRPLDEPLPRELGNRFALVLFSLPSSLATPFERLAETKRRMDAIKHSPEAVLTFGLIRGIGRTGPEVERFLVDFFANKATGVTTNVPGPREPRYLAGTRITRTLGWAPESGDQTLGTSIFTYDGQVHIGFKVDVQQVPRPEELLANYRAELDALLRLAPSRAGASR
jgi:WS/DGAT/MGAT family acyltransferase